MNGNPYCIWVPWTLDWSCKSGISDAQRPCGACNQRGQDFVLPPSALDYQPGSTFLYPDDDFESSDPDTTRNQQKARHYGIDKVIISR